MSNKREKLIKRLQPAVRAWVETLDCVSADEQRVIERYDALLDAVTSGDSISEDEFATFILSVNWFAEDLYDFAEEYGIDIPTPEDIGY